MILGPSLRGAAWREAFGDPSSSCCVGLPLPFAPQVAAMADDGGEVSALVCDNGSGMVKVRAEPGSFLQR